MANNRWRRLTKLCEHELLPKYGTALYERKLAIKKYCQENGLNNQVVTIVYAKAIENTYNYELTNRLHAKVKAMRENRLINITSTSSNPPHSLIKRAWERVKGVFHHGS